MKTIIVATNYSTDANNAIRYAAALARYTNSKVVLFNSFQLSVHASNTLLPAWAIDELVAANRERLEDIAFETSNTYGIPVDYVTRNSFLNEELDYQVERLNADLVVMGMSEICSQNDYENTTTSIVRGAKYPVLIIPENASFDGISTILFAYDPGCMNAANKLSILKEVATQFKAQVQVYHVDKTKLSIEANMSETANNADKFEALLSDVEHSYTGKTEDDVVKGIENGIKDSKADLLVMVPHKYGFWQSIVHKSKTIKMAHKSKIPLLAIPNPTLR